jgi:hypothetical protein
VSFTRDGRALPIELQLLSTDPNPALARFAAEAIR